MIIIGIGRIILYGILNLIIRSSIIFDKQTKGTAIVLIDVVYMIQ